MFALTPRHGEAPQDDDVHYDSDGSSDSRNVMNEHKLMDRWNDAEFMKKIVIALSGQALTARCASAFSSSVCGSRLRMA